MSEEKKEMKKSSSPAKDLTVGSPMKLILGFAFPMFLGLLFQQFYSLVDTMIVGKYLGVDPFAGVGSTGSLNFIVIGFCMGLCSGFSVPISQSFGAKDFRMLRKMVTNSVWLCVFFSAIFTTLMLVFCRPVLTLMNTPENIFEYAYIYIFIIFAGIPCTILYNMTAAILRALGDSKSPIIFLAISSAINIGLDLLLIIVFKMSVDGAALATVISQGVSGVISVIYIKKKFDILLMEKGDWKLEGRLAGKLTGVGIPMGLQYSITGIGSVILQTAVNGLGSIYVASMTAGSKINVFLACPFDALGQTMAPYAGQGYHAEFITVFDDRIIFLLPAYAGKYSSFYDSGYGIFIACDHCRCYGDARTRYRRYAACAEVWLYRSLLLQPTCMVDGRRVPDSGVLPV